MIGRRDILSASACCAIVLLAGCSGGSTGADHSDTPLPVTERSAFKLALTHVPNTAGARSYVEFGRPTELRRVNRGTDVDGPYAGVLDLGLGRIASSLAPFRSTFGVDPSDGTYAVTVGDPPRQGTLVTGLRLDRVDDQANDLGATRRDSGSGASYRFRPDDATSFQDRLAQALPGVIGLNILTTAGTELRFGPSTAAIDRTTSDGLGALADADVRSLADCLADPLAAIIGTPQASAPAGQLVGVGVSDGGRIPVEQLCVVPGTKPVATVRDRLQTVLTSGTTSSGMPWSTVITHVRVVARGGVVAVTAAPARGHAGVFVDAFTRGDLPVG